MMRHIKLFSLFRKAFLQTPGYGRTIAVLGFVALCIKQITLIITSHVLFQEATWRATLGNYSAYVISDFLVFFVLIFFVIINKFIKRKIWRLFINIFAATLLIFFIIDIVSLYVFQTSISVFDISSGMLDPSVVKITRSIASMIILAGLAAGSAFLFVQTKIFQKYWKTGLACITLFFALLCLITSIVSRPGFSFPRNILSNNRYAIEGFFQDRLGDKTNDEKQYLSYFTPTQADNKKPNIIIVFAESFSAIDSKRVGGTYDNLPYFDKMQADGMTFTNFLADGCTSDTAHVALLQGVEPWKFSWQEGDAYTGYRTPTTSLAQFFTQQKYNSIFLSTASLSFLNQGAFLSGVGFTAIGGEELFRNEKKYVFDAAPDIALYKQALQTIQQQKSPYLLTLQTISFHRPYNTPYGNTESAALRYTDKSLYYFYEQLKKKGFFDNGLLIVVGDHRKMDPLVDKEKKSLGPLRYGRAVATVIGAGIVPGTINDKIIQHTDFFYSLKKLIGDKTVTVSKFFNDVFSPRKGRDWGVIFCRYFTSRYGIITADTSGFAFEYISDVRTRYPNIYSYMQAYSNYQSFTSTGNKEQKKITDNMTIIAHRGSPKETTENSLQGFQLAQKHGANGIEFDVTQTKDGVNIVMHGPSVYPTTCGDGILVGTHTLDWLQKHCPLTNGEKIRTLEEMLIQLSGMFDYYFIELKANTSNVQQQTLDAMQTVKNLGMTDNVIFTSYDKTATYLLGATKGIHAGRDTFDINDLARIPGFGHEYFLMPIANITKDTAQQITDMGKKFVVYVVNTRDDLEKVYDRGVRTIMTDDVVMMKEYADKLVLEGK